MKNWHLTFSTYNGGSIKCFYTIGGAIKYLRDKCSYKGCFVDLDNEKLGVRIRLYVPDEKDNWTLGLKWIRQKDKERHNY